MVCDDNNVLLAKLAGTIATGFLIGKYAMHSTAIAPEAVAIAKAILKVIDDQDDRD